jgi:hypothetical protein
MIKANELRIGNYMTPIVPLTGSWAEKQRVNDNIFSVIPETFQGIERLEYFQGIPLTEEWLVKFGFEKSDGDYYWKVTDELDFAFGVSFTGSSWRIRNVISKIGCVYVHQLQNLYFALTGAELMITKKPAEPEDPIWTEVYAKMEPQERSTYQNYLHFKHYDVANKLKERMIEKYFGK